MTALPPSPSSKALGHPLMVQSANAGNRNSKQVEKVFLGVQEIILQDNPKFQKTPKKSFKIKKGSKQNTFRVKTQPTSA